MNLNPSKAAGPDALKPILLKELSNEMAPILTTSIIFQKSLNAGAMPNDWKHVLCQYIKKGPKYMS